MSELSKRRRAQNEVVFKQRNIAVKDLAKSVLDNSSRHELKLKFVCECADETCREVIEIPLAEFEHVRHNSRQFLVRAGHQQLDIESVTQFNGYLVVEKFEVPSAPPGGMLNRTK
jgi:hypothetical protein